MTTPRRRRQLDRSLALALAIAVTVAGLLLYRSSDIRNANLVTASPGNAPSGAFAAPSGGQSTTALPSALTTAWTAPTDARLGAVASGSGVVVTADQHEITAHDAVTGVVRWTYSRSNRTLCAVGSGDEGPADMSGSQPAGITTVFDENGFCSQVMTFDPATGARAKVRTSANQQNGALVFGDVYAGWIGPTRIELWRNDLVRTIQYGEQANPPKPNQSRLGCTLTDLAIAATQFGTVEHCPAEGTTARVVLNFDDPSAIPNHPNGWDVFQHSLRVDIDTGAPAARIVGITSDRVAVLVSAPSPAVVVYDATGKQTSRTPVDIPAADIVAADSVAPPVRVTPGLSTGAQRLSLVGSHLLAVSMPTVQGVAPTTAFPPTATSTATAGSSSITDALGSSTAPQVGITDLRLDWVADNARGLPAVVGSTLLLPTAAGLSRFDATAGPAGARTITVDRGSYRGRVDATAVDTMVIEVRGTAVVALRGDRS